MSEVGAATSAPVATPSASPAPESAAPANDNAASEAAKTLAARRTEIRAKLNGKPPEKKDPSPASSDTETTASATTAKSSDSPSPSAAPDGDELAALIREDRRVKGEIKRLEAAKAEHAEYAADVQKARVAREAYAKGDRIGMIKALFPEENIADTLFWDLAKAIGDEPDAEQPDVRKIVEQEIAAKLAADRKAAEDSRKQQQDAALGELNGARESYVDACGAVFTANKGDFPAIAAVGVHAERIREYAEDKLRAKLGRVPSVRETLVEIEKDLAASIRGTPYAAANDNAQAPRAATVSSSWRDDPGRPMATPDANETLDQIRQRRRAALRQAR